MRKYRAIKVHDGGFTFDSRAEHRRRKELQLLVHAGQITDLRVHPRFPIIANAVKICDCFTDFAYIDTRTGRGVIEDGKGFATPIYRLKRRLLKALNYIDVVEIRYRQ